MGSCCSVPSVEEAESAQQFRALDANKNNLASHEEMSQYVASRAELWAMLSVNLGLSEEECRKTATRVAMELASGQQGAAAMTAELTEAQFHNFRTRYMVDGKGAQEFFHRCVFATFDTDGNHSLDAHELDRFLDTFYKSGSIFEGDSRLPERDVLKELIFKNNNSSSEGTLTFEQIRAVIGGTTSHGGSVGSSSCIAPSHHSTPEAAPTPEQTPEPMTPSSKGSEPEQTPEVRIKNSENRKPRQRKPRQQKAPPQSQQQQPRKPRVKKSSSSNSSEQQSPEQQATRKVRQKPPRQKSNSSNASSSGRRPARSNSNKSGSSNGKPRPAKNATSQQQASKAKRQ